MLCRRRPDMAYVALLAFLCGMAAMVVLRWQLRGPPQLIREIWLSDTEHTDTPNGYFDLGTPPPTTVNGSLRVPSRLEEIMCASSSSAQPSSWENYTVFYDLPKPYQRTSELEMLWLYQVAHTTARILERFGYAYVACGGTLIGALRDRGIVAHDDDIDLCTDKRNFRRMMKDPGVLEALKANGLQLLQFNRYKGGVGCRECRADRERCRPLDILEMVKHPQDPSRLIMHFCYNEVKKKGDGVDRADCRGRTFPVDVLDHADSMPFGSSTLRTPELTVSIRTGECPKVAAITSGKRIPAKLSLVEGSPSALATEEPRYTMKRGPDWSAVNKRASKTAYDGLARALARLNGGPDPADWGRSSRSTTAGIVPKMIKDNGGTLRETIENEVHMSLSDRQAILMWMLESLDALNVDDAVLFTAISIADRYGSQLARRSRYYAASAPLFLCGADLQQAIVAALCIALKTADTFDGKDALEKGVTVGDFLAHLCGYMLPPEQIYTVEAAILNELNFDVYSQTAEYVIRSVFSAHCPNSPAEPLPREYWLAQYLMEVLALSKPLAVLNTQASLAAVCIACEVCGAYSPVLAPS
ncbi:hypothetical protein FOZ60_015001 [Perkinsus olseni]|uniref:Uncharacterized protein n=2 Tax=Perkinsus olseni TaxID=32597 RepID=A0A7J6P752_PEROL|nr:hypothetical protein FOZ60_015001 [Perkinsus olseni]